MSVEKLVNISIVAFLDSVTSPYSFIILIVAPVKSISSFKSYSNLFGSVNSYVAFPFTRISLVTTSESFPPASVYIYFKVYLPGLVKSTSSKFMALTVLCSSGRFSPSTIPSTFPSVLSSQIAPGSTKVVGSVFTGTTIEASPFNLIVGAALSTTYNLVHLPSDKFPAPSDAKNWK